MADEQALYSQIDQEIDGDYYHAGDKIKADLHVGTREVLKLNGYIGSNRPAVTVTPPPEGMAIADMNRDQLVAAIRLEMPFDEKSDDELRDGLQRFRDAKAEQAERDAAENGAPAKPLNRMNTAELEAVAAAEGVTFAETDDTNAKRVAAIEAKRAENA